MPKGELAGFTFASDILLKIFQMEGLYFDLLLFNN